MASICRHGLCFYKWFNGETLTCMWNMGYCPVWSAKDREIKRSLQSGKDSLVTLANDTGYAHENGNCVLNINNGSNATDVVAAAAAAAAAVSAAAVDSHVADITSDSQYILNLDQDPDHRFNSYSLTADSGHLSSAVLKGPELDALNGKSGTLASQDFDGGSSALGNHGSAVAESVDQYCGIPVSSAAVDVQQCCVLSSEADLEAATAATSRFFGPSASHATSTSAPLVAAACNPFAMAFAAMQRDVEEQQQEM
jgi:hypothetical protein